MYQIAVVWDASAGGVRMMLERRRVGKHPHPAVRVQRQPASQVVHQAACLGLHRGSLRLGAGRRAAVDVRARVVAHTLRCCYDNDNDIIYLFIYLFI